MNKRKIRVMLTAGLSLCCFLAGALIVGKYLYDTHLDRQTTDKLRLIRAEAQYDPALFASIPTEEQRILNANTALKKLNPDFAAWITIPDTPVDYPVMYTPGNPEFYLRRNFYKEYSIAGTPFLAEGCDPESDPLPDNMTIYGHHLSSGDMFAAIKLYKDKTYWENHQTILFSTASKVQTYQIVAAFSLVLEEGQPDNFRYDYFTYASTKEEYDGYIRRVKSLAFYDTGLECCYGEKLLTLSTCASSTNSGGGRLVLVAKQLP